MTAQSKTTIKTYFETGDKPTQAQFIDLIDSYQDANTTLDALIARVTAATSGQFILPGGADDVTALPINQLSYTNKRFVVGVSASAAFGNDVQFQNINVSGNAVVSAMQATIVSGSPTLKGDVTVSGNLAVSGAVSVSGRLTAGTITDWHHFYRETVATATADWVKSTPYAYTLRGFRRVCNGAATVTIRKNGVAIANFDVSAVAGSAAVSADNFVVGDSLDVIISAAVAASGMAIYAQITRAM